MRQSLGKGFLGTCYLALSVQAKLFEWGKCEGLSVVDEVPGTVCGNFSVPLDYTNESSNETIILELAKVPATNPEPYLGSILLNFGGPGGAGRQGLLLLGRHLQELSGGHHDLLVFDPRGTGTTFPFSCYPRTEAGRARRTQNAARAWDGVSSSDTATDTLWGMAGLIDHTCKLNENATEVGQLIGTGFFVRDMMQIVDALQEEEGEDGMLRYWGWSYGSIIGATAAAMYPDRIDRMVMDGIVNAAEYYNGWDFEWISDTDKLFFAFFEACVAAGPTRCPLASSRFGNGTSDYANVTAKTLETSFYNFLETELKTNPVLVDPGANSTSKYPILLDYTTLKTALLNMLYSPSLWPRVAAALDGLLSSPRNLTAVQDVMQLLQIEPVTNENAHDAFIAIRASDKSPAVLSEIGSLDDFRPVMERVQATSRLAGDAVIWVLMQVARWEIPAKERYEGEFRNITTSHPVLILGNTYDPVTPLVSAFNLSAALEGSVVVQHDGYGHTTLEQPSACTERITREYFINGTVPEQGHVCKVDVELFPLPTQPNSTLATRWTRHGQGKRDDVQKHVDDVVRRMMRVW